jgi:transcriptional regulator with XRE-family HTH domain
MASGALMQRRTRRANSRGRGKWQDDPLVPMSGERMHAALQHSGLGLADLARKLGQTRQTLDYIVRGATKRCRRSRRAAIARALAVPDEWLGGSGEGGMDWLLARLGGKRQSHLAINRLGRRCEGALQRDGSPVPNAIGLLLKLALPGHWRSVLLHELPEELIECRDLRELERDIAQTALANAFEAILQPWLTGEATLDYRALERLSG